MELEGLAPAVGALDSHNERIKLFVWWLTTHGGKTHARQVEVGDCYIALSIARPDKLGPYFAYLTNRKELLKDKNGAGYTLEAKIRADLDQKHGASKQTVAIKKLLRDLPAKLPTLAERQYLDEALICYENEAFRAAVVMTWNLAYAHLCDHILTNRLAGTTSPLAAIEG